MILSLSIRQPQSPLNTTPTLHDNETKCHNFLTKRLIVRKHKNKIKSFGKIYSFYLKHV
jgi:hypothetical protein